MGEADGHLVLDFEATFPHRFWVSSWSTDATYPNGFRYKLLSAHDRSEDTIALVVVLEQRGGAKEELERLRVSPSAFERVSRTFVEGLADEYAIDFEEHDFSDVTTERELERRAIECGWAAADGDVV